MPGIPNLAARQFALDPHFEELLFEQVPHSDGQFGDGEDAPSRRQSAVGRQVVGGLLTASR